jgi:gas vesicle protein
MTDYERFGEYRPSERSPWGLGITLLLVGLGAGALTALLLAPRTGRQTRKLLRRKYEDTMDTLNERTEDLRERGSVWFDRAKQFAGNVGETASDVQERVRAFSKEARSRAR